MGKCGCCGCKQCNRKIEKIIITATQGGESMIHEEIIGGKSIKDLYNSDRPGDLNDVFTITAINNNDKIFYEHNLCLNEARYKKPLQVNSCGQVFLGGCDPCYDHNTPWQTVSKKLLFKQNIKRYLKNISISLWSECDLNHIRSEIKYQTRDIVTLPEQYFRIITEEYYSEYVNKNCIYAVLWKSKLTVSEVINESSNNSGIGQTNGLSHAFTCCNNSLLNKHIIPKSKNSCIIYGFGDLRFGNGITRDEVTCSDPTNPDMVVTVGHILYYPNFLNLAWWEQTFDYFEILGFVDGGGGGITGECLFPPDKSTFKTNLESYIEPIADTDIIIDVDIVYSEEQNILCYNKFEYNSKIQNLKTAIVNCGSNNSHIATLDLSNSLRSNSFESQNLYNQNFSINGQSSHNIASGSGNFNPFGYIGYSKRYDNWNSSKLDDVLCFRGRYEDVISYYDYFAGQICYDPFNQPINCSSCRSPEGSPQYAVTPARLCKYSEYRGHSYFSFYLSGEITLKIINNKISLLINIYQKSSPFYTLVNKQLPDIREYCSESIFGNLNPPPGGSFGPHLDKEISAINPFAYLYRKEVILDDIEQLFTSHRVDIVGDHPNILQLQDHITVNLYDN